MCLRRRHALRRVCWLRWRLGRLWRFDCRRVHLPDLLNDCGAFGRRMPEPDVAAIRRLMAALFGSLVAFLELPRWLVTVFAGGFDRRRLVTLGIRRRFLRCLRLLGLAHFFPSVGFGGGLVGSLAFGGGWCPLSFFFGGCDGGLPTRRIV